MLAALAFLPLASALSLPLQLPLPIPQNEQKLETPIPPGSMERKLIPPQVDAFIRAQQVYWNSSGLSIAVVRRKPGKEWEFEFGSYGQARADGTPVSPDTMFAIASDSKVFTAAGVGLLIKNETLAAERGRPLRWDTKVAEILGDEWVLMDKDMERGATLQDLLSHRTGLPRHDYSGFSRTGGVSEMISKLQYLRPSASLREKYQYNNLMYEALSYLPEKLLNQSFESYIAQHIFAPLGMNSSTYSVGEAERRFLPDGTNQLAHGFHWSMRDWLANQTGILTPSEYFQRPGEERIWAGAGGIISSARDLSVWVATLLNQGRHPFTNRTVIPAEIVEHVALGASVSLEKAEFPETSPKVYGCGQNRFSYRGHEIIEHGGSNPGFKTIVTRLPYDQIGLVVLTNDDDGVRVMEPVKFRIIDELLGFGGNPTNWAERYLKSVADGIRRNQDVTPRPSPASIPSTPFSQMAGVFVHETYGAFQPCFISVERMVNTRCQSILDVPVVRQILNASDNVPTFVVPFQRMLASYIRLAHFDGNLFNASMIWTTTSAAPTATSGDDVIVGLDRRYVAEWVPGDDVKEKDGWAFKGDFWGKEGDVRDLEGAGRASAEVWFGRAA
ncbi:F-box domain-containing protein [Mycena indigotica]|uniref:F-box domain-containing protein n=1 Tax=Mycena indigotica TaxID=2126181 RepID=A0A8H6SFI3_9AGAR|nr:F-box domain-containing protein [Mycena indigotica]KAF7296905.1 F-box domain-containing protein [Mycena indigotica]